MNGRHSAWLPCLALATAALLAQPAGAHRAHTHGQADLDVAIDGSRLSLALTAPANDVVGFEHAPRSAEQEAAVAAAAALLNAPVELFALPPAAGCTVAAVKVEVPWPRSGDDAHADFTAQWDFDCADPSKLSYIDVHLVEQLPGNLRMRATVIDARGQSRSELRRGRTRLSL